jgi:hypothetical protein
MSVKVRVKVPNVERRSLKVTKDIRAEESNPRSIVAAYLEQCALNSAENRI